MTIEQYIDAKDVLEQLEKSSCFGVAHNPKAKECKKCDLQAECWAKSASNNLHATVKILNPEVEAELAKAKSHARRTTGDPDTDEAKEEKRQRRLRRKENEKLIGLKNTRKMSTAELWNYLDEVGGECKEYDNDRIQRMRLVVAIKKALTEDYNAKNPDNPIEP